MLKYKYISTRTVRMANAWLMADIRRSLSPETKEVLKQHPVTPEKLAAAGRKAMQGHSGNRPAP